MNTGHGAARRPKPATADFARSPRRLRLVGAALLAILLLLVAMDASAQAGAAADSVAVVGMRVAPDTVRVGDPFRAAVFVRAPAEARVELAVPAAADAAYQPVGEGRAYPPDSAGLHRAVATMVVWDIDPAANAAAEVRVTLPSGAARTIPIQLPLPVVRSVLPADSTQPRPAKGIIPTAARDGQWAWIAAAVLAALALLAFWRRRRPRSAAPADPRTHALAELDRLRASGAMEADAEAFSAGTGAIVREFAAAADPALGPELTTAELLDRLARTGAQAEDVARIEGALRQADLAKFARRPPSAARALAEWEAARRWVEGFRRPESAIVEPASAGSGR